MYKFKNRNLKILAVFLIPWFALTACQDEAQQRRNHELRLACIQSDTCGNNRQVIHNTAYDNDYDDHEYEDNSFFEGAAVGGIGTYGAYKLYKGKRYVKDRKGRWITETEAKRRKQQSKHQKALNKQKLKQQKRVDKQALNNQKRLNRASLRQQKAAPKTEYKAHNSKRYNNKSTYGRKSSYSSSSKR